MKLAARNARVPHVAVALAAAWLPSALACAPSPEATTVVNEMDSSASATDIRPPAPLTPLAPAERSANSKRDPAPTKAPAAASAEKEPAPKTAEEAPAVRLPTTWASETINGMRRIEEARAAKLPVVKALFEEAKVAFPPGQILFRGFKKEKRIEVWAATEATGPLSHVTTYEICYASGALGPKRREGDLQVPEGFYTVNLYNPSSTYYLAMQVSYPNLSDRILGDKSRPGSEIMIHGNCVSIGCMAMSDERAQEIWLEAAAVRDKRGTVHVHLFPTRDMAGLVAKTEQKEHVPFWENIKEGFDYFQAKRLIPSISIDREGRYHFKDPS